MLLIALGALPAFAQTPPNEPSKGEIREAYLSKSGGGRILTVQWERWRIKEIRGWKLRFKRIGETRSPGLMTVRYQALARKQASCATYNIRETIVILPANPQIKPVLVVEPAGVVPCP